MSEDYNVKPEDFVTVGETVKVRLLGVDGQKVKLSMKEKIDLKEMLEGIQTESSAGSMEYAFKSIGLTPAQFPGADKLTKEAAKKKDNTEAAAAPAAAPEPEPVADAKAAEPVVEVSSDDSSTAAA